MAEKKEHEEKPKHEAEKKDGKREGEGKAKAKHLHQIITTRAHDGSFGHEHVYKDNPKDHHSHPPVFAGTSQDMEDLHAHMDDHFGGGAEGHGEPDGDEGGAAPAAGGGAPVEQA